MIYDYGVIEPTLAQGAFPKGTPEGWDFIVNLSHHDQKYSVPYIRYPFDDGPMIPPAQALRDIASTVNALRSRGTRVFVHCDAGLNRSGLIVGLSLIDAGMMPQAAIALIRAKRHAEALCNREFEAWLLAQPAASVS